MFITTTAAGGYLGGLLSWYANAFGRTGSQPLTKMAHRQSYKEEPGVAGPGDHVSPPIQFCNLFAVTTASVPLSWCACFALRARFV